MKKTIFGLLSLLLLAGCGRELTVEEQFLVECYEAQTNVFTAVLEERFLDMDVPEIINSPKCELYNQVVINDCKSMFDPYGSEIEVQKYDNCVLESYQEEIKSIKNK